MGAGTIVTVLSNIDWRQVIETAPKIAEAAIRLWDSVAKRNNKTAQPIAETKSHAMSEADVLRADVDALKQVAQALQEQMRDSTEVIKQLAAQNAHLVDRVELSRKRVLGLAIATAIAIAVLLGMLVVAVVLQG